jgi:cardiolipin synthase
MIISIAALAYVALSITGLALALHAMRGARTPQGAVGWVVFLVAMPVFAVPSYLFLGHHRISDYLSARRDSARVVTALETFSSRHRPETPPPMEMGAFEAAAQLRPVRGNTISLLIDGRATFDAIFAAIDGAQSYLLVQFYIMRDDGLGRDLRDRLLAARARGVAVWMLFDGVGSMGLPDAYVRQLRAAGVNIVDPKRARGPKTRLRINYRNHRKTVIADGVVGFIGGHNVGDEYLGLDPVYGRWRDTQAELRGPVVSQLQLIFAEDWHYATGEVIVDSLHWEAGRHPDDMTALIVATGPGDSFDTGSMVFFAAIVQARRRIWVASAYFVPDMDTLVALKHAALRGVEVRVLVPDVVDHWMPWLAAFAYFDEVMEAGVEIWRYTDGFMHQKAILVDDRLAAVGTANMDNRSFRLNFEAMALFPDPRAAAAVEAMLVDDFAHAYRLTKRLGEQSRVVRLGAPVARLFAPLL